MLACVLRLSFVFYSFESDSDSLYFLPRKQSGKRLWLNLWSEEQNREGWPSCPCLDLQPGFPILGSTLMQRSPAVWLWCYLTQTRAALSQGQHLIAWKPKIAGQIFAWHMVRSTTGNHATTRDRAVRNCSFQLTPNSHLTGSDACCVRKARYHPLIAGSILSFWEIDASDSSCASPSKLCLTFCKGRPRLALLSLLWSAWGNPGLQHFPISLVHHVGF